MILDEKREMVKFLLKMDHSPSKLAEMLGFHEKSAEWREYLYPLDETGDRELERFLETVARSSRELAADPFVEIPDRYSHLVYIKPEINWGKFNLTDHLVLAKVKKSPKETAEGLERVGIIGRWHVYPYMMARCILPKGMTEHAKLQYMQGRGIIDKYIDITVTERGQYFNPSSLHLYSRRQDWVEWYAALRKKARKRLDVLEDVQPFKVFNNGEPAAIAGQRGTDLVGAILNLDGGGYTRKELLEAHAEGTWIPSLKIMSNRLSSRLMVLIFDLDDEQKESLHALRLMLPILDVIKGKGMISPESGKRMLSDILIFDFLVPPNKNELLVEMLYSFLKKRVDQFSMIVSVDPYPINYPKNYPSNPVEFFKKVDNEAWSIVKSMDKGRRLTLEEQWKMQVTLNGES